MNPWKLTYSQALRRLALVSSRKGCEAEVTALLERLGREFADGTERTFSTAPMFDNRQA